MYVGRGQVLVHGGLFNSGHTLDSHRSVSKPLPGPDPRPMKSDSLSVGPQHWNNFNPSRVSNLLGG